MAAKKHKKHKNVKAWPTITGRDEFHFVTDCWEYGDAVERIPANDPAPGHFFCDFCVFLWPLLLGRSA